MELKDPTKAEANFERALRLSPNDGDINHNYGWFLCQSGREPESIKYFLQALRNPLYGSAARTYSAAGVCSMRAGNTKDADEFFQRALKLEPDDPAALLPLAQIRFRQGKIDDARRLVSRYNKLVSPNPESLWLALRIERRLGERVAEQSFANQLRRRFPNSAENQALQRGQYD
jgi:type IV pilus assembly protein PilF